MIVRTDISAQLEYGVKADFMLGAGTYQPKRGPFVQETTSTGAFETYADMGAVPWPALEGGVQGPGGTDGHVVVDGSMSVGQVASVLGTEEKALRIYNMGWAVTFAISHDAINDQRLGNLEAWARSAGVRFNQHMDYLCFNALTQGASTTSSYGLCYDGVALISASHSYPRAQYTTNQDNEYTVALTLDNFETVRVAGAGFLDSRGQPLGLSHNLLIVPTAYERIGRQITGNPEDYGTTNRAVNPYAGGVKLLVAPGSYLDSTSWYVVDDSLPQKPIILQKRQEPEVTQWDDENAPDGGIRYIKIRARYNVGYGEWPLILQGNT